MNAIFKVAVLAGTVIVTASTGLASAGAAPMHVPNTPFGAPQLVVGAGGAQVVTYTVDDLRPSETNVLNVPLKGEVPLAGSLWQATTSVEAVHGSVVPAMELFNARSPGGPTYRVIDQAFAPDLGVSPLDEGGKSTGTIYFDITGPAPTEVTFGDGVRAELVWSR